MSRVASYLVAALPMVACGLPDETIDLLNPTGGAGQGAAGGSPVGGGGSAGEGGVAATGGRGECSLNEECALPVPQCDPASNTCGTCPAGLDTCASGCADTTADPLNCGECDQECAHNQFCFGGDCHCLPGMTLCGPSCRDTASDPDHCGACDAPCDPGERCETSQCLAGPCSPGFEPCPAADNRIACVQLAHGYPFCGACGVTCAPGEVCAGDHCQAYQPATPCTSCPCPTYCDPAFPDPAECCEGVFGLDLPVCVAGGVCP